MKPEDLLEPLAEYLTKEIKGLDIELINVNYSIKDRSNSIALYAPTATHFADGSAITTYIGCVKIDDGVIILETSHNRVTRQSKFSMENVDSFDDMFEKIKELIELCANQPIDKAARRNL